MAKFKADPKKTVKGNVYRTTIFMDTDLYRWLKTMAVVNNITIASVLNQAIEFAKKNSERISL